MTGSKNDLVKFVQDTYQTEDFIPLHAPVFNGNEETYVCDTIRSTFVSSVGAYVDQLEKRIISFSKGSGAVATVSGTASLQVALRLAGCSPW